MIPDGSIESLPGTGLGACWKAWNATNQFLTTFLVGDVCAPHRSDDLG